MTSSPAPSIACLMKQGLAALQSPVPLGLA
jgi:hypothetical protein